MLLYIGIIAFRLQVLGYHTRFGLDVRLTLQVGHTFGAGSQSITCIILLPHHPMLLTAFLAQSTPLLVVEGQGHPEAMHKQTRLASHSIGHS